MRSKSQAAWETATKCAKLTEEADDPQEREYYARLRDAWITLAKRCEFSSISDVTDFGEILSPAPRDASRSAEPSPANI